MWRGGAHHCILQSSKGAEQTVGYGGGSPARRGSSHGRMHCLLPGWAQRNGMVQAWWQAACRRQPIHSKTQPMVALQAFAACLCSIWKMSQLPQTGTTCSTEDIQSLTGRGRFIPLGSLDLSRDSHTIHKYDIVLHRTASFKWFYCKSDLCTPSRKSLQQYQSPSAHRTREQLRAQ